MKATLEFTLPEEQVEFDQATHAREWYCVAWDVSTLLRNLQEGAGEDLPKKDRNAKCLAYVRKRFYEILDEHGLEF